MLFQVTAKAARSSAKLNHIVLVVFASSISFPSLTLVKLLFISAQNLTDAARVRAVEGHVVRVLAAFLVPCPQRASFFVLVLQNFVVALANTTAHGAGEQSEVPVRAALATLGPPSAIGVLVDALPIAKAARSTHFCHELLVGVTLSVLFPVAAARMQVDAYIVCMAAREWALLNHCDGVGFTLTGLRPIAARLVGIVADRGNHVARHGAKLLGPQPQLFVLFCVAVSFVRPIAAVPRVVHAERIGFSCVNE